MRYGCQGDTKDTGGHIYIVQLKSKKNKLTTPLQKPQKDKQQY